MSVDVLDNPLQPPLWKSSPTPVRCRQITTAAHAKQARDDRQADSVGIEGAKALLHLAGRDERACQALYGWVLCKAWIDDQDLVRAGLALNSVQMFTQESTDHTHVQGIA